MNISKRRFPAVGTLVLAFLLASCGAAAAEPTPTLGPPPPKTPMPPPQTPLPQPTPGPVENPPGEAGLFRFVKSVAVTPDDQFAGGLFLRLGYVPARDQVVAAFGARLAKPSGKCTDAGHAYKVYSKDMAYAGEEGVLHCEGGGDSAELFVDNVLYDVTMHPADGGTGWLITKYDAVTWKQSARLLYALSDPRDESGDMMIAMVNGVLDISSLYANEEQSMDATQGASSHHNFFTPDLEFLERRILSDTEHANGNSMAFVEDKYYFLSSTAMIGEIIMMEYDSQWKFLGQKTLFPLGIFPEGLAHDGTRFYVAYMATTRNPQQGGRDIPNIHLGAFDRDWNLIEEIAVTRFTAADNVSASRPWILLHDNILYVAYDVQERNADQADDPMTGEAFVAVYELAGNPPEGK